MDRKKILSEQRQVWCRGSIPLVFIVCFHYLFFIIYNCLSSFNSLLSKYFKCVSAVKPDHSAILPEMQYYMLFCLCGIILYSTFIQVQELHYSHTYSLKNVLAICLNFNWGWGYWFKMHATTTTFTVYLPTKQTIYLSSLQSSKTQYSTKPGNFGSPFIWPLVYNTHKVTFNVN